MACEGKSCTWSLVTCVCPCPFHHTTIPRMKLKGALYRSNNLLWACFLDIYHFIDTLYKSVQMKNFKSSECSRILLGSLESHLAACGWEGERMRNQKESKGKPSREGVCKASGESEE